jgi:hypothetical protein
MTHWTEAAEILDERESAPQGAVARYAPGVFAFVMSAALGVYLVCLRPVVFAPAPQIPDVPPAKPDVFGGLAPVVAPGALAFAKPAVSPFGQIETGGFQAPSQFAVTETPAPMPPVAPPDLRALGDADAVPLPPRRPNELTRIPARSADTSVARLESRPEVDAPATPPSVGLLGNLFSSAPAPVARPPEKPQEPRMAYAAPPPSAASSALSAVASGRGGPSGSGSGFGGFLRGLTFGDSHGPATRFGDRVAVYDISAHVVYLPDGTKLEAHSGLGSLRDDTRSVAERMRGVTPPATYALTPREASFHGVDALRLTPIDSSVYGRAGLLAHSYMLGPDGDSNGCVSFRDYEAFLRAFRSGQINKLVVVTSL